MLPIQKWGYYREYTVRIYGMCHKGVRRVVYDGAPNTPDACYYTTDHYASYRLIVE